MQAEITAPPTVRYRRAVGIWLLLCMLMVMLMVTIGGVTRLTGSGLSMVKWEPIHGTIPPIGEEEWLEEFSHYRESPEYQKINRGMSLSEFKDIFWLEYIHRVAGRVTGLVFLLPLLGFIALRALHRSDALSYGGIFLLGGIQGGIGWWMVSSGLIEDPMVSPYRLTTHLLLACIIFSLLLWQMLRKLLPDAQIHTHISTAQNDMPHLARHRIWLRGALGVLLVQIALGGFVAGLDAGFIYNTFPLMDGDVVPSGLWLKEPWFLNFFENVTMVQFLHRWWAMAVLAVLCTVVLHAKGLWKHPLLQTGYEMLMLVVIVQIMLGISTLVMVVPVSLASLHQVVAVCLLGVLVYLYYIVRTLCLKSR